MRIGLVVHQFPSPEHPYILDWVRELLRQGAELVVLAEDVTRTSQPTWPSTDRKLWPQVRRINTIDRPDLSLFIRGFLAALRHPGKLIHLVRVLEATEGHMPSTIFRKVFEYLPILAEEFDLIHFNAPQIAIRRFELKDIFQAASLVSFRGQDFTYYPDRYDRLLQEADHLHFISQFLVEQAMERSYDSSRHSLIYPMVDTDFYTPASTNTKTKDRDRSWTIFTAARLEWVKGWEFALQAVALLVERGWDVHYYIAGDGEMKDTLVYTIEQLGIGDRIHLLGWQSPEAVRDWMQKADLYLLASVSEAFNNSVLQAQACGLPVVCSDEGGLTENIEDGITGFLAYRRDAWDLAQKTEVLLNDQMLMSQFRKRAIERAQQFAIRESSARFIEMYRRVSGQAGR
jgi:colanic acid/amylovoran biosynthesis glycosyltransferase